jgi:hypothetical protein
MHNDTISCVRVHQQRNLAISSGWDRIIRIVSVEFLINGDKVNI